MSTSIISITLTTKRLVVLLLSVLVLILGRAAAAFASTPFGSQYGGPAGKAPGAAASGLLGGIEGGLPFTGGPLLYLVLLGVVLLCCGLALLGWRSVSSRR
jgi:hypothetical protein